MQWTVRQLAEALGVAAPAGLAANATLSGVSIDSRTIQPGELFIAIRGPRHDGHDFVGQVLEGGKAAAAVVDGDSVAGYSEQIRGNVFVVDDTLAALQRLGARACEIWRSSAPAGRAARKVAAVAGSVGKTTTKEILAALLSSRFRVLKTQGNLNNEYGLPLTLLKFDDSYDMAVVELGMSHRGELALLTKIAAPDVGVVTRVAVEHLEFFSSIDEIALAERELIENLPGKSAAAVLNADDERVAKFAEVAPGPVITFGTAPGAAFRAENISERGLDGSAFDLVTPQGRVHVESSLIGRHNVMNAVGAFAAASVFGITADDARRVFPSLVAVDKRGEVVRFTEGFTVINDSYNSSPTALNALTELLAGTPGYRRRILASGEMLELGGSAPDLHRECGRNTARKAIDWIFGVRGHAADFIRGAIAAGYPEDHTQYFENSDAAATFLAEFVAPGDLLLVKGSRGVRMEKILQAIEVKYQRQPARVPETSGVKGRG